MKSVMALAALALCLALALGATAEPAGALPANFTLESATPGQLFDLPTEIAFLPDGRFLVAEKAGHVWMVTNGVKGAAPMWSREQEVLNADDRGLIGIAVDPRYYLNHYVYLLYTVDPDSDGVDTNEVAFGRLTRYQVGFADSSKFDTTTRTILMGATWRDAPPTGSPTHTVGSLRFGADGSLLLSVGEGSWASQADAGGLYPSLFGAGRADPYEDIGAYRAQYVGCLAGKILRLNPANGHGYASNPYFDGNLASKRSRVYAYGLRNPFRFVVKPGTGVADTSQANPGTLYIGDVGWYTFEEADVAKQAGTNFGWPCNEGFLPAPIYPVTPPAHSGCDSIGTFGNPTATTLPIAAWNHSDGTQSTPAGLVGNCSVGGVFYQGSQYPAGYHNAYFFADYGRSWIKVMITDANDQLVQVQDFGDQLQGPVDLETDPVSGDVFYVAIIAGEVRRLHYTGGGALPPVAVASATPDVGPAPLAVTFSSTGSYDPNAYPLSFSWVFGDGGTSNLAAPSHTYTGSGTFNAILIADNGHGGQARDTVQIIVSGTANFPTTGIVDAFDRANGAVGNGWTGETASASIQDSALVMPTASIVAAPAFSSATQEAYLTLRSITTSAYQHNLMLKVQGPDWFDGHIEVSWHPLENLVYVSSYDPAVGWVGQGQPIPVAYQPGDRFGARAYPNGALEVYRNNVLAGSTLVSGWAFNGVGGRIGISTWGADTSRLDDFGGGDAQLLQNTKPHATILAPLDSAFYDIADGPVQLVGRGSDAQDPPDSLHFRWDAILHHNNHTHPGITAFTDTASFIPDLHNADGTPVWYETRLIVTDTGGLSDTLSHFIFPEVDLSPAGLGTTPAAIGTVGPAEFHFTYRNLGVMPDPRAHWQITAAGPGGTVTLAQGDTLAGPGGSVPLSVVVPATLAPGDWTLRVTLDTLNVVVEMNEGNDAQVVPLTVFAGQVGVEGAPTRLALSAAYPNPAAGPVRLALDLPRRSPVAFDVMDPMGRRVWSDPQRDYEPGRWTLAWPGTGSGGRALGAGLYLARVRVAGHEFVRRIVRLR